MLCILVCLILNNKRANFKIRGSKAVSALSRAGTPLLPPVLKLPQESFVLRLQELHAEFRHRRMSAIFCIDSWYDETCALRRSQYACERLRCFGQLERGRFASGQQFCLAAAITAERNDIAVVAFVRTVVPKADPQCAVA